MKNFICLLLLCAMLLSVPAAAYAAGSPTGPVNPVDPYTPVIVDPSPKKDPGKIITPVIVITPTGEVTSGAGAASGAVGGGSAQSADLPRTVIMPEFGIVSTLPTTNPNGAASGGTPNGQTDDGQGATGSSNLQPGAAAGADFGSGATDEDEGLGALFAVIVRETVVNSDPPEEDEVHPVEKDPIKDTIPPEKMHYLPIDEAAVTGATTNEIVEQVVMQANAANRSIVSAIVITADEDVAWKIGKQPNDEDRYVAFTFYPEAIGLTEADVDTLVVFVNGHPITLVKNENGTFTIKLSEWGLVTFEVAAL